MVVPYLPEFISALKETVPYHGRDFDGESKHWLIDADYEDELREVASEYYDVTIVVTEADAIQRERRARASAAPPPGATPLHHTTSECLRIIRGVYREEAALHLLPSAPISVIVAAYRAVAKLLHPDVAGAGTTQAMVEVNRAYDTLRRRAETR